MRRHIPAPVFVQGLIIHEAGEAEASGPAP